MTIGTGKLNLAGLPTPSFAVEIDPFRRAYSEPNGMFETEIFTANVIGGVGPFDYLWMQTAGEITATINTPTAIDTTFTFSGTEISSTVTIQCEVTDTGDSNVKSFGTTQIIMNFSSEFGP